MCARQHEISRCTLYPSTGFSGAHLMTPVFTVFTHFEKISSFFLSNLKKHFVGNKSCSTAHVSWTANLKSLISEIVVNSF